MFEALTRMKKPNQEKIDEEIGKELHGKTLFVDMSDDKRIVKIIDDIF